MSEKHIFFWYFCGKFIDADKYRKGVEIKTNLNVSTVRNVTFTFIINKQLSRAVGLSFFRFRVKAEKLQIQYFCKIITSGKESFLNFKTISELQFDELQIQFFKLPRGINL